MPRMCPTFEEFQGKRDEVATFRSVSRRMRGTCWRMCAKYLLGRGPLGFSIGRGFFMCSQIRDTLTKDRKDALSRTRQLKAAASTSSNTLRY